MHKTQPKQKKIIIKYPVIEIITITRSLQTNNTNKQYIYRISHCFRERGSFVDVNTPHILTHSTHTQHTLTHTHTHSHTHTHTHGMSV